MGLFRWDQDLQTDLDRHGQECKEQMQERVGPGPEARGQQQATDDGGRVQGHAGQDRVVEEAGTKLRRVVA